MAIIDDVIPDPEPTSSRRPENPPADEFTAPVVTPTTTEVDAATETVEDRMTSLNLRDSKYTNLNREDAQRSANTRGLINSTMAGAAGVEAGIRASLPIAQQDAKTYTDTRMANQDVVNTFEENRQNTNLNIESAAHGSQLVKDEMKLGSALTSEENTILNDLTMKRDEGLAELTEAENKQLAELEAIRDSTLHSFDIDRDQASAVLNENLATLESLLKESEMILDAELRLAFETALQDDKFSDTAKIEIVQTMSSIITDTQQQIVDIGMSDRSAEQQAAAITLLLENRDAALAVYENLLSAFTDWDWGTDFTPEQVTTPATTTTSTSTSTSSATNTSDGRDDNNTAPYTSPTTSDGRDDGNTSPGTSTGIGDTDRGLDAQSGA